MDLASGHGRAGECSYSGLEAGQSSRTGRFATNEDRREAGRLLVQSFRRLGEQQRWRQATFGYTLSRGLGSSSPKALSLSLERKDLTRTETLAQNRHGSRTGDSCATIDDVQGRAVTAAWRPSSCDDFREPQRCRPQP